MSIVPSYRAAPRPLVSRMEQAGLDILSPPLSSRGALASSSKSVFSPEDKVDGTWNSAWHASGFSTPWTATVFVNTENKRGVLRRVLPEHRLISVYRRLATSVCLAREPTFDLVIFK